MYAECLGSHIRAVCYNKGFIICLYGSVSFTNVEIVFEFGWMDCCFHNVSYFGGMMPEGTDSTWIIWNFSHYVWGLQVLRLNSPSAQ